jgi:hypothetical protein
MAAPAESAGPAVASAAPEAASPPPAAASAARRAAEGAGAGEKDSRRRNESGFAAAPPPATVTGAEAEATRPAAKTARVESEEERFRALSRMHARTGDDARRRRDGWREFLQRFPRSGHVDEARRAMLEAGASAYQLEGHPEDLEVLRRDVQELSRVAPGAAPEARRILDRAERRESP